MNPAYKFMIIAWVAVIAWIAFVIFTNRKVHPKALFVLFMVELWERFSYYGMRALLVLYMVAEVLPGNVKSGFGFNDSEAYGIYGAYGALVYLTPIFGGLLADRYLGFRKAIVWGAILMAAGQFTLMIQDQTIFFLGLGLLILGNGFFKPNISSMIGKYYPAGDPRRDGAFTIFYMGINIGAFLTPLTCGTVGQLEGWRYGFMLAGIGMVLGLLIFLWAQKKGYLEDKGHVPEEGETKKFFGIPAKNMIYVGTFFLLPIVWLLVVKNDVVDVLLFSFGAFMVVYMIYLSTKYDKVAKERMWVIVLLLFFTTVFWTFFELAGSAMNPFTERHVDRVLFGIPFETSNAQSFNPLFIMLFAPVFAWLWIKMSKAKIEPSAPVKFGAGLILLGAGFLVLNLGKGAAINAMVPAMFLVFLYLLHTLGELALSPVGLSLVTKLAPEKIVAFMMGFWFLSSSIAHQAGKHIARLTAVNGTDATPEQSLELALNVFNNLGLFAVGAGLFLFLLSPMIKRWMHGIN
jgi:proton-dependent oligopeptide transporter, POT family